MALPIQNYKGARDFYPEDKRIQKYIFQKLSNFNDLNFTVVPDYPHKRFADQRSRYICLIVTLAIDKCS